MDEVIKNLLEVKGAIQSLECFVPTERNCHQILGSIQRIDAAIKFLQKKEAEK